MAEKNPSELARETFKMLAARKLAPTPENFSAIYHEIAGHPPAMAPSAAFRASLTRIGASQKIASEAESAAISGDWDKALEAAAKALAPPAPPTPSPAETQTGRAAMIAELHEQIARMVEFALPALGDDDPKIGPDAAELAKFCRENAHSGSFAPLKSKLSAFNHRLSFVAEDQAEIRGSLLGMLRMVFENIAELSLDDRWLHGQIELLMAASQPPLSLRRLDDLGRRLKDVIFKQSELKRQTLAAQEDMKRLLASFIEKLGEMAELSGTTHNRIEAAAKRIESAKALSDIGPAIAEAIGATRAMAAEAAKARQELVDMKRKADDSATEINRLRAELDAASSAARHDPLTGALNRKGLDEAAARELGRSARQGSNLCVSLLDIDNFKKLNDQHGHHTGDAALAHLCEVAREAMRPQDTLSRFGGEEFVILMPDTEIEGAVAAMTRLQRELTRRFFMSGQEKLLITFSAGVAQIAAGESIEAAIERADQGMYQAKRAGKNKVVAA